MSQLTHPNTTKVFVYGELDDGSLYMIMEYLEGKNLNQSVRADGPFPVWRALPILVQVCGALDEAHQAGIIHRDLKPENIFLVQSAPFRDFPKVLDFGLAKVGEAPDAPRIGHSHSGGNGVRNARVHESRTGPRKTSFASKRPLLAGNHPLRGIDRQAAVRCQELDGLHPPPRHGSADSAPRAPPRAEFPSLLEQVIARALAKNPGDRFGRAADFGLALQAVLEHAPALPDTLAEPAVVELPTLQMPRRSPGEASAARAPSTDATIRDVAAMVAPAYLTKAERVASRRPSTVRGVSLRLLVGVALGFLLLGVGLALVLIRFVLD